MAYQTDIGGDGSLFVGEDKIFEIGPVYSGPIAEVEGVVYVAVAGVATATPATPIDISSWDVRHVVRKKDESSGTPLLSQEASIIGIFSATPSANTQRAQVTYTDAELDVFKAGDYRYSWKRLTNGAETVLGYGTFSIEKSTNHD